MTEREELIQLAHRAAAATSPFRSSIEAIVDAFIENKAARATDAEAVGVIELSDYVQLNDSDFIPRKKALTETSEGAIQNLPVGTKLYTHPPAKPESSKHWSFDNPGRADQYRAEARAVRDELGFGKDSDNVSPRELREAIKEIRKNLEGSDCD